MYDPQAHATLGPRLPKAKTAVQSYLETLSPGSRRTVAQSLDMVAVELLDHEEATREHIAWHELGPDALAKAREQLAESYEPATVNKMLSCVRGVLRACVKRGFMSEEAAKALCAIPNVPMFYHPPDESIRLVTASEVKSIFEVCRQDRSAAGRRDAALLAILLATGVRRTEAAAIDIGDYSSSSRSLYIRSEDPKKLRSVALKARACRLIDAWLDIREGEPGPLLLPVNKSGVIVNRQLTDQAIYDIIRRLAVRARVPHITTRALRRTFVATLIARGLPLEHVQQFIGHASWVTTESYQALAVELRERSEDLPEIFINVQRSPLTASEKGGRR